VPAAGTFDGSQPGELVMAEIEQSELNRRHFLASAAAATCACALECPFASAADAKDVDTAAVDIGTAADFPKDGPYDKFAKKPNSLIVVRSDGKLYAMTAVCTHKKKQLKVEEAEIVCTAHDSPFDNRGVPKAMTKEGDETPAKDPLDRFAISRSAEGHLIVDKSKRFAKEQWEDPASFVKLEAQA
jgi:nitrite reductase/ring-hydroxylating ferredoxin subunit